MKKVILLLTPFLLLATSIFQTNRSPLTDQIQEDLSRFSNQIAEEQIYLHLDRTFYRPGETIWFSAYIRGMNDRKADQASEILKVELYKPNGTVQSTIEILCNGGNCTSGIVLPRDKGGVYTIKAFTNWQQNTKTFFEKEIQVQQVLLPNLNMKLDFEKKAYGANDMVVAELELEKLNNQPLKYVGFKYKVHLGGNQYLEKEGRTDFEGKAKLYFNLPKSLESSDGILNVMIPHQGLMESISRSVPIVLNNIDLAFFPEGGDIIAGQQTYVAFEALNEFGKPADIDGQLEDSKGNKIVSFSSLHNGMGKFLLETKENESYSVRITKPEGIDKRYKLPASKASGLTLNISHSSQNRIHAKVKSNLNGNLHFVAQSGDSILFDGFMNAKSTRIFRIDTKDFPIGISRLTVFNDAKVPLAERLVFINKHKKLNIEVETDKEVYMPREKVDVKIKVTNEHGDGVKGNFSLSASDNKLLTYADDKQGHILSKVLLEHELKGEIHEPNFYFDEEEADADAALDLLMMTHGWRRFEWEPILQKADLAFNYAKQNMQVGGKVLDKYGRPVEGAIVKASSNIQMDTTDKEGRFELARITLPYNGTILTAYKDGAEISRKGAGAYRNDYMLTSYNLKANFKGYVYDKSDKLCRKCSFSLRNEAGVSMKYSTDKEGSFAIYNLLSGPYVIDLLAKKDKVLGRMRINIEPSSNNFSKLHFAEKSVLDVLAKQKTEELEELLESSTIASTKTAPLKPLDKIKTTTTEVKVSQAPVVEEKLAGKSAPVTIRSEQGVSLSEVVVVSYKAPLISADNSSSGATLTSEQIRSLPTKNISALAASTAGLSQIDDGDPVHIRGSRANATDYYIDGIRVSGSGNLIPSSEISQLQVITGGVEAKYGGGETNILRSEPRKDNKLSIVGYDDLSYEADRQEMQQANLSNVISGNTSGSSYYSGYRHRTYNRPTKIRNLASNASDEEFEVCDIKSKNKSRHCEETELVDRIRNYLDNYANYLQNYKSQIANLEFVVDKKGFVGDVKVSFDHIEDKTRNNWFFTNAVNYLNYNARYKHTKLKKGTRYSVQIHFNELNKRNAIRYYNSRRFYNRKYYSNYKVKVRSDFRSTAYWNGNILTNQDGESEFSFWNGDDITNYAIVVEGFGKDGSLGRGESSYAVQAPFSLISKIPHAVASLDTMKMPVTLINNTDEAQTGKLVVNAPKFCQLLSPLEDSYHLDPHTTKSVFLTFAINKVSNYGHRSRILVSFETKDFYDAFNKPLKLIQRGYPHHNTYTDVQLENEFEFEIKEPYPGSIQASFKAHPNPVSEAAACMEKIIRQPTGCFEQTSSSNYPNLLAIQLMKKTGIYNAQVQQKATKFLQAGYERLSGYEVKGGGFSLYGRSPARARLSAYGLMQFHDMAAVYPVEKALLDRTAKWLLENRSEKGGWGQSHYPQLDAYILWAMCEAGYGGKLKKEIDRQFNKIKKTNDPYQVALMCNVLMLTKDDRSDLLLKKLIKSVKSNGGWAGADRSVMYSRGRMLSIETTALALLALSKSETVRPELEQSALNYILKSRNHYGFGSTQSTILSLKAIIASMGRLDSKTDQNGIIDLIVNGHKVKEFKYDKQQKQGIVFDDLPLLLTAGKHKVEVKFRDTNKPIPFDLEVKFCSKFGQSGAEECPIKLATTWNDSVSKMGETIRLITKIENITSDTVATPLAIIGIPGGMTAQPWQLKELMDKNIVEYYEAKDDQIVFYLDHMSPNEVKLINLDLKAELPGHFQSPASQAYLYYNNETVSWALADAIEIEE